MKRVLTGLLVAIATLSVIALVLVGIAREPSSMDYSGYGAYQVRE